MRIRGRAERSGGRKVEVFLMLEGLACGPIRNPIRMILIELLNTFDYSDAGGKSR
jgi:hypothetical protein